MEDSQHTKNIQINKVIGEYEKCVLFYGKTNHMNFLANPILLLHPQLFPNVVVFLVLTDSVGQGFQWDTEGRLVSAPY